MDLLQIRYFQTVARLEHMTRAAQELYKALAHQPILKRPPQALHAALGLGRTRGNQGDVELLKHSPHLRLGLPASQLLANAGVFPRIVPTGRKQSMPIRNSFGWRPLD